MRDTSVIIVWGRPIKRIKNVKTDDGIIRTVYSSLELGFFCFLCLLCFLHLLYLVCGSFFGFRGSWERVRPKQSFFFHCQTAIRTNLFANTHFALICFGSSPRCVLLFPFQLSPFSLATLQCIRAYKASPCCLPAASLSHSLFLGLLYWEKSLQFECVENYLLHSSDNRIP